MKKRSLKIASLLLVLTLILSSVAFAAETGVYASDYINTYSASVRSTGSGGVKISFDVTGTGLMDEIGATSIYLYESSGSGWSLVKTFNYTQSAYSYLMSSNTRTHSGSVTYSGTTNRQYYATVYFWAAKGGSGDSASKTTSSVTA